MTTKQDALVRVDRRGDEYLVTSYSRDLDRSWCENGYLRRLPIDAEVQLIGEAIIEALGFDEPPIAIRRSIDSMPVRALGLRSYTAYANGLRSIKVRRDSGVVHVVPYRNLGGRRGFSTMVEEDRVVHDIGERSIGEAALAAFEIAV